MADNQKSLSEIMFEITRIQEKLCNGEIEFSYDKIFSALGAGHPAEIMDNIISDVFWTVRADEKPLKKDIEEMVSGLEGFKNEFEIEQLETPISHLKTLLENYQEKSPAVKAETNSKEPEKSSPADLNLKSLDEMIEMIYQNCVEKGIYKSAPEQLICCDEVRNSSRIVLMKYMEFLFNNGITVTLFDHVDLTFLGMCLGIVLNYLYEKNNGKIPADGESMYEFINEEINIKQVPLFAAGAMGCQYESKEYREFIDLIDLLCKGHLYYGYFSELNKKAFNSEQEYNDHALTMYEACFLFGFDYRERYCRNNTVSPVFDFDDDYTFCNSLFDESGMLNIAVTLLKKGRYDRLNWFLNNNSFDEIYPEIYFDVYLNAARLDLLDYVKEKADEFATRENMLYFAEHAKGKSREYIFNNYYLKPHGEA